MREEGGLTIGVLSPLLGGAFFGVVLNGVSEYLAPRGGRVVAIQTRDAQLGSEYPWGPPPFDTRLCWDEVDGYVAVLDAATDEYLAQLVDAGKPVVLVSHQVKGLAVPEVMPDNRSGIAQSVDHLIGHGHRRIAFAGERERGPGHYSFQRHEAYRDAMRRHGAEPADDLFFITRNSLEDGGEAVARDIIAAGTPCTALIAATDLIAAGAIKTFRATGLRVPEDIAVTGFDDRDFACQLSPPLASVRHDFRALGQRAASTLLDLLAGRDVPAGPHLLSTSFVPRESCGCGRATLLGTGAGKGLSAAGRLGADLTALLAGPNATAQESQLLNELASTLSAVFEASLESSQPLPGALRDAAQAAYRAFPRRTTVHSVVECMQAYRRRLINEVGYSERVMAVLDDCLLHVSMALSAADAASRGEVADSLQESLREEYYVSLALVGMRGEAASPESLDWLRHTQVRAACLALWQTGGDPAAQPDEASCRLRVAGTLGEGVSKRLPVGSEVPGTAFPPVGALTAEGCQPDDVVLVLPVRTASRSWGLLAVAAKPEAESARGGDMYFLWTALLGTALDHEALVEGIRRSEERYALAARAANDGLWDWDVGAGTVFYSQRWKSMLGYDDEDISSSPSEWLSRAHPDEQGVLHRMVAECLEGRAAALQCEHRARTKQGTYRWSLCRALAIPGPDGRAKRLVGSLTDIHDRKELESRLRQAALYDSLTGLPNRSLLMDRMMQAMTRAKRSQHYRFCVLFMDLDGFKMVNDSLGHVAGDLLLMKVAERITGHLRQSDTAVRFGGDEFAILLDNMAGSDDPSVIVARLQQKLSQPYHIEGREVVVTATIGLAISTAGYDNPEDMIRDADTAMYAAKATLKAGAER